MLVATPYFHVCTCCEYMCKTLWIVYQCHHVGFPHEEQRLSLEIIPVESKPFSSSREQRHFSI